MASYRCYVDRHKVSDACYEIYEEVVRSGKDMTAAEVKETLLWFEKAIKLVEPADVEPVVHAHWIPKEVMVRSPFARNHRCSHCGHEPLETNIHCPHCGAKMDEEATHD